MIKDLEKELNERRGELKRIKEKQKSLKSEISEKKERVSDCKTAHELLQVYASQVKNDLKTHIETFCSLALQTVLKEPYSVHIDFVNRRGRIEADLWLEINGVKRLPEMSGGGVRDLIGMALRFGLWGATGTRNILLLDEPLVHLKGNEMPTKGVEAIKLLSQKLGMQTIMVSHDPELIAGADKIFKIAKIKRVSYVKTS